jgi:hypothetical protein
VRVKSAQRSLGAALKGHSIGKFCIYMISEENRDEDLGTRLQCPMERSISQPVEKTCRGAAFKTSVVPNVPKTAAGAEGAKGA